MTASELEDIIERTKGYTLGEWVTGENTVDGVRHYGVGIDDSYKMVALTGWVGAEDAEESIANARLIESAPDLLRIATKQRELLRRAATIIDGSMTHCIIEGGDGQDESRWLTDYNRLMGEETKTDE